MKKIKEPQDKHKKKVKKKCTVSRILCLIEPSIANKQYSNEELKLRRIVELLREI